MARWDNSALRRRRLRDRTLLSTGSTIRPRDDGLPRSTLQLRRVPKVAERRAELLAALVALLSAR
jgi:hypothetical protein